MAFRRRRNYRRRKPRTVRRRTKRAYRRRTFRKTRFNRSIVSFNPQYYRVKRKLDFCVPAADLVRGTYGCYPLLALAPASNTLNTYASTAFYFKISDIPNVSEFGNLYDQYKITGVKLRFIYMSGTEASYAPSTGNNYNPQVTVMMWQDNDDITTPTASNAGWSAAQETGRVRAKVFPNVRNNTMSIFLRPKNLSVMVDQSGTTTGRGLTNPWIDGATGLDAEYFGLKVLMQCPPNLTTQPTHYFKCIATYYTIWRNRQ